MSSQSIFKRCIGQTSVERFPSVKLLKIMKHGNLVGLDCNGNYPFSLQPRCHGVSMSGSESDLSNAKMLGAKAPKSPTI